MSRMILLGVVAVVAMVASLHAFITEGVGVSGVSAGLLAIVLIYEAVRVSKGRAGRERR